MLLSVVIRLNCSQHSRCQQSITAVAIPFAFLITVITSHSGLDNSEESANNTNNYKLYSHKLYNKINTIINR